MTGILLVWLILVVVLAANTFLLNTRKNLPLSHEGTLVAEARKSIG